MSRLCGARAERRLSEAEPGQLFSNYGISHVHGFACTLSRPKGGEGGLKSTYAHYARQPRGVDMHTIALVADTHGFLADNLCPALEREGVTRILHAGDVVLGKKKNESRLDGESMIAALSKVAQVDAVRGDNDGKDPFASKLPATLTYRAGAVRFVVHHGADDLVVHHKNHEAILAALRPAPDSLQPAGGWRESGDIIVCGHSHIPRLVRHASGVTFLNPGTAGGPSETKRPYAKKAGYPSGVLPQRCAVVRCSEGDDEATFEVFSIDLTTDTGVMCAWTAEEEEEGATNAATGVAATNRKRKRTRPASPAPCTTSQKARRRYKAQGAKARRG